MSINLTLNSPQVPSNGTVMPKELYCPVNKEQNAAALPCFEAFFTLFICWLPSRSNTAQPGVKPHQCPNFSLPWTFLINFSPTFLLGWLFMFLLLDFMLGSSPQISKNLIFFCPIMQGFFSPIWSVINLYSKTSVLRLENSLHAM